MCGRKKLAFTILEILVTLSMLALILAAVYGSFAAATSSASRCKAKSVLEQQARLFLQRITCELRCCYAGRSNESGQSSSEHLPAEEAVRQEKPPLFVGKDVSSDQSFLQFVTSGIISKQNHNVSELAIVSYKLDKSGTTLLRSERKYVDRFENDDSNYNWLAVFANVKTIMFEYFDGKKWQQKWNSKDIKTLPRSVRISLVLETEDVGPLSSVSIANIECQGYQAPAVSVQKTTDSHQLSTGRIPENQTDLQPSKSDSTGARKRRF